MMELRRLVIIKDTIHTEGGLPAVESVTRVAACAVIANPLAGEASDALEPLVAWGAELGERLVKECLAVLPHPPVAYGKAAIVGTDGDIEHAAALLHPRMGKPMRDAIGGGQAIIPSNVKIGAVGASIDIPLGHKDDVWSFDEIDTLTVTIGGAPRPNEIVVIVALSDGGRPRPRVAKSGAIPPRPPRSR
jgi:Amino acid synthesis